LLCLFEMSRLMTERETSERLGVSMRTLQKWRLQGSGPRFVKLGRSVRYDAGDLEQYIEAARRGLWLDRGELEKLIARAARDFEEVAPRGDDPPPRGVRYRDGDDDYYFRRDPRPERRWYESLGDIFD